MLFRSTEEEEEDEEQTQEIGGKNHENDCEMKEGAASHQISNAQRVLLFIKHF